MAHVPSVVLCVPLLVSAMDHYELVTTGQACPESSRIRLPCGACGPDWGNVQNCKDQCSASDLCTHIAWFQTNGCRIYSGCDLDAGAGGGAQADVYKRAYPAHQRPDGSCDVLAAHGSPCVAAHSVVRALYQRYHGPIYRVLRDSDKSALDIGVDSEGLADVSAQDKFCAGTGCYILRIYDQSPRGNHLDTAPAGGACRLPGGAGLKPVNATREQVAIGGHTVYGAYFEGRQGYRNDKTNGVATREGEESMYMVARGDHYNEGCCFDYGNAETNDLDDGEGTMEAVYFGSSHGGGHGQGAGPWVMADLENGLWAGDERVARAPSVGHRFVMAMAKGKAGGFALKGGSAQGGSLTTLWEGGRPKNGHYDHMKLQGAIILGIGGDASCAAVGTFYEGAMTADYTSDTADNALHANIVASGYGQSAPFII